jgi:hypothetical protein
MKKPAKTSRKILWLPLILSLALTVASCASSGERQEKKELESLRNSVDTFNGAFRWEEYTQAADYVPRDKKEGFWKEVDKFKGKVRISDYEVREVTLASRGASGIAILRFQYWRAEAPILRDVTFTQKWYYNEKDKLWRVSESGFGAITGTQASF